MCGKCHMANAIAVKSIKQTVMKTDLNVRSVKKYNLSRIVSTRLSTLIKKHVG